MNESDLSRTLKSGSRAAGQEHAGRTASQRPIKDPHANPL